MKQVKAKKIRNRFGASLVKILGNKDGRQLMMMIKRSAADFSTDEICPFTFLSQIKPEKRS
jgi:hypothetical protein